MQLLRAPQSLILSNGIVLPCGLLTKRPLLLCSQVAKQLGSSNVVRCPEGQTMPLKPIDVRLRPRAAGVAVKVSANAAEPVPSDVGLKDRNLIFVAGATGRVGSRTVRELLKSGSRVRAGVRSPQRAESLVQSVQQMKLDSAARGLSPAIERLEIVECDLEQKDQIGPALGNASVVICCIGASEKEIFDITGPCRIDYRATKNLIDAATVAQVDHFILLTSLGTNKVGFPAAILNLFWGVLIWKRKAEEVLLASGLPYTIVRPGGMERPTDAYKETHNLIVSLEDTLFGGQVSNLQVAELMAFMAKNRSLSYFKVVEVIAETTAPLTPMEELLAKIPSHRAQLDDAVRPETTATKVATSVTPTTAVEKQHIQSKAAGIRPLSPYTAYEDLKPPTSPTPTRSTGSISINASVEATTPSVVNSSFGTAATEVAPSGTPSSTIEKQPIQSKAAERRPLSPYTAYEDLKPPTSPTPSTGSDSINASIEATIPSVVNSPPPPPKAHSSSPFTRYEDLKSPASPCPSPSGPRERNALSDITSQLTGGNDVPKNSTVNIVEEKLASRLSPYLAYPDLKPPSSPSPNAPRKLT